MGTGIGLGVELGYRLSPHWSVGAGGQYHESNADDRLGSGARVRGGTAGLLGTYHFTPYERIDPYLTLGTGYRFLWQLPPGGQNNELTHGIEIAKAQLGADLRVSKNVAIGPMVGADVNVFMWNNPEGNRGNVALGERRLSTFGYAGLQGRFDIGGAREGATERVSVVRTVPTYFLSDVSGVDRMRTDTTGIRIDIAILRGCGIDRPATYFAFDSSAVQGDDANVLQQVAKCVTTGPLRGQSIEVIGHTDPRGSERYNEQLGQSRADSVAAYLAGQGVSQYKVSTTSRGEEDATGTEPEGWARDRRVDIRLVGH
jgi:outer membrane protein OmpA-like peptidoglycan-associated protein